MNENNFYDLRILILKYDLENYIKKVSSYNPSLLNEKECQVLNRYIDDEDSLELIREAIIRTEKKKEVDQLIQNLKVEVKKQAEWDSEIGTLIDTAFDSLQENFVVEGQRSKNLFYNPRNFIK